LDVLGAFVEVEKSVGAVAARSNFPGVTALDQIVLDLLAGVLAAERRVELQLHLAVGFSEEDFQDGIRQGRLLGSAEDLD
jgi:hypothetical protein